MSNNITILKTADQYHLSLYQNMIQSNVLTVVGSLHRWSGIDGNVHRVP